VTGLRDTDEQALLRESVAKLARTFGHDYYAEKARADGRTTELWRAVGEQGYLRVNLPEEYGGGGMGITELAIVCEELAAAGCPLLLIVVSPAIGGSVIARFGTEEQKRHWVPGIASGELLFAFAITEPDAGSNSHKISTVATRDGDGYRLRGTKYYISGVDEADEILVVTRTGVDELGRGRLSLFVVPPDAEGLTRTVIPVGITAPEKQFTLFFDDVYVDADRSRRRRVAPGVRGPEPRAHHRCGHGLRPRVPRHRPGRGIREATQRVGPTHRRPPGRRPPVGGGQDRAGNRPAGHPERGRAVRRWIRRRGAEAANMAKFAAAEAALQCLDTAIQTHGGNGMALEYGLVDMWGMTRLQRIAPVSREMVLNYVANRSLGLPKGY
jgi:alkylation response protein AidB-like acyl-CoA dehydrogenase